MSATETAGSAKGTITSLPAASQAPPAAESAAQSVGQTLGEAASNLGQSGDLISWGSYFQALAVLFLIVALLAALLWFLKQKGGIKLLTKQGDLALEARLPLGPKKSLVVVRFLNKKVLLGVTDQQITMLTELHGDEYDAPDQANTTDFQAVFDNAEPPPK